MAQEEKGTLEEWQQYPVFTEMLTKHDKFVELRGLCLKSCQQLDRIVQSGKPEEKEAAQKVLNAYGYALSLLDEAIAARDKVVAQQSA
jgi:hypothetical protein